MKNKKGFTLIELLAVIVILGLLLAIAIPSISKYIVESRKKTYITTAQEYIASASISVNNMDYDLSDLKGTYYISIDCIGLEKGGSSPFGEWEEAYVVTGLSKDEVSYDYYWFAKDSGGYGADLIKDNNLNNDTIKGKIDTLYKRPLPAKNGSVYIADKENSCSFKEHEVNLPKEQIPMIMAMNIKKAFWQYRGKIKNITFEYEINIPEDTVESWDVSAYNNGLVMAYIKTNKEDSDYYDLYIQGKERIYANPNSSQMFF